MVSDTTERQIDPVRFEVIRNALVQVTEEMGVSLRRSAYSTNIKTRADFSCVLFDADLRLLAQNFAQPSHLGSMVQLVPEAVRRYGTDKVRPGDTLCTNIPFPRGVHLNDITVISPVFHDSAAIGYVANLAHHVDVGGGAPASVGSFREVYQEGVIIPPVRVAVAGEIDDNVFNLLLAQIRSKRETAGDFRAQLAANRVGARGFEGLVARYGWRELATYVEELLRYTSERTRAACSALPRGRFYSEGSIDSDGYTNEPVKLCAAIAIADDGVTFDLSGSDPQRRAPVNSTYTQSFSACTYVLKCLIDSDIPANHGFYAAIRLVAPPDSVVNCSEPSPVVGGHETQMRLIEVMFAALAEPFPGLVPAGTKGMVCHAGFGGHDPRTGEYYCFLETLGGGYGARERLDGPDGVQPHVQNTENAPIEETEQSYPVRIARYELVEDSEGAGEHRGGLGLRRDYAFDHGATFSILADRDKAGPHGLFGGLAGRPAQYFLIRGQEATRLPSKTTVEVEAGDVVRYETCGGGGYGPPGRRNLEKVGDDVRDGKVSLRRARDMYGFDRPPDERADAERGAAVLARDGAPHHASGREPAVGKRTVEQ